MRIELSTTYKHYLSGEEAVLECYGLGFNHIQLGAAHKKANLDIIKQLKKDLKLGFSMHAPFPNPRGVEFNPKDPIETKPLFFQSIENAHKLGVNPIVVHPGSFNKGKMNMEKYYEFIGNLCDKASDYGLTICIENKTRKSHFGRNLENLKETIEKVKAKNLGICFDISHARTTCDSEEGVIELFKKYFKLIKAVHLVDTHGKEDDHLPPGYGKVSIEKLIRFCVKNRFKGPLTFEVSKVPEDMVIDGYRFIRETLAEEYFDRI